MTIRASYSQFLAQHGVPLSRAQAVANRIDTKLKRRKPFSHEEALLSAAFLQRPGANTVQERELAQAVDPARPTAGRLVPSQVKILLLAPDRSRPLTQTPRSPATAAKEPHHGLATLTSNMRGSLDIRALADRIARTPSAP